MEELIERFLLIHGYCPLPEIGTLEIKEKGAEIVLGENIVSAPAPVIKFNSDIEDTTDFLNFISRTYTIELTEAANRLRQFCLKIKNLEPYKEIKINQTGIFMNEEGKLHFSQFPIPHEFLPTIKLKRVIHPNNVHSVRVGDEERTSEFMSDLLNRMKIGKNSNPWIYAAALFIIALGFIIFHFFNNGRISLLGNGSTIQVKTESKQYENIP